MNLRRVKFAEFSISKLNAAFSTADFFNLVYEIKTTEYTLTLFMID